MKKYILVLAFICFFNVISFCQIVTYALTTDGSASSVNENISAYEFTKGIGVGNISFGSTGASASGWSLSEIDLTDYYQISFSPKTNYRINISNIEFGERRSSTGVTELEVRFSKTENFENFTTIYSATIDDVDTERAHAINGLNINIADNEVFYLRLYGYKAESSAGTWRVNDNTLKIYGNVEFINPNDATSILSAGAMTEPLNISSLINTADGVSCFDFNLKDAGTSDNLPTFINKITINKGDANQIDKWTDAILSAKLFYNNTEINVTGVVSEEAIIFEGDKFITIDNNTNKDIILNISLKNDLSAINDNDGLEFKINYNNIICDATGSVFGEGIIESGDDNNKISIVATKLSFSYLSNNVQINQPFALEIKATDINNNTDLDANNTLTVSLSSGTGTLNTDEGFSKNLVQGTVKWEKLVYDKIEDFILQITSAGFETILTDVISCVEQIYFLNDNFEDANLTDWQEKNPEHWAATTQTSISGNYSLQHNFANTLSSDVDIISHPLSNVELNQNNAWRFKIKYLNSAPSSSNNWTVFLMADNDFAQMMPSGAINAYAVGVNFVGSDDFIKLWEITNGVATPIITTDFLYKNTEPLGMEILRKQNGEWILKIDQTATFQELITYGTTVNTTHNAANNFGIYYKYSSSNSKKIFFDDIYFGAEIPDNIKPFVKNVEVRKNNILRIQFNEPLTPATAQNIDNYIVDNSIGKPKNITFADANNQTIELEFETQFADAITYSIEIQNVEDLSNNIIDTKTINFVYNQLKVENITVNSDSQITVIFSKDIETISANNVNNYFIDNQINNPKSITVLSGNSVQLTFENIFVLEREYNITISNITDIYLNPMQNYNHKFIYYISKLNDLVISELMLDISPVPAGLPAAKYIEIYNNSLYDIDLNNWSLQIGTSSAKKFPAIILPSNQYALICEESMASVFSIFGTTIPILTASQLTTTSKNIIIKNSADKIIETLTYFSDWYKDDNKSEGGWSLERIDADNICNQADNWSASENYTGGTPNRINSVNSINPDTKPPYILDVKITSARNMDIYFSEMIDSSACFSTINYLINNSTIPYRITADANYYGLIHLTFLENFIFGENFLTVKNITDKCQNKMADYELYFDYQLISPLAIEVKSPYQAIIYFSEPVRTTEAQTLSNYLVNNDIQNPVLVFKNTTDSFKVHIEFDKNMIENQSYSIEIKNITDIFGNMIVTTNLEFAFHSIQKNDIIFNEIMADISPTPLNLPKYTYIELYNTSNYDIWLSDWIFQAEGQSQRKLPNVQIKSKDYALLVGTGKEVFFEKYGTTIDILSTSDLSSTGKLLILKDANNNIINELQYSNQWYKDDTKDNGGWSLEKIDSENHCGEITNWTACNNASGGTPCKINSVAKQNPDNTKPKILSHKVVSSNCLQLHLSKKISESTALNSINYFLENTNPNKTNFDDTSRAVIYLYFEKHFTDNIENTLFVENLADNCGNIIDKTTLNFTYKLIYPSDLYVETANLLKVQFSENVDITTASQIANFTLNNTINPEFVYRDFNNANLIYLQFTNNFTEASRNTLNIKNIKDINGNIMLESNMEFIYYTTVPNDLVINEILFNPLPDSPDFVEIYNRTNYDIDLSNIKIATRDIKTNEIKSVYNISSTKQYLKANQYLVVTTDTTILKLDYKTSGMLLQINTLPTFSDDQGIVIILNQNDSILDEFPYNEDMHFALLSNKEGVSLERIDYNRGTLESNNWHSASTTCGFATPGYENSQYNQLEIQTDMITISPKTFSPDNDNYQDILNIQYNLEANGYVCNIKIFDSNGYLMRDLYKNELLSQNGILSWDGLDDAENKVRIGIYIVYIELFNLKGEVKIYKEVCVVAMKK